MQQQMNNEKSVRLQKFIADCGVTSRRKAEELILQGEVEVNGKIMRELGCKVSELDTIKVKGERIGIIDKKIYLLLNKPVGVVTSSSDEKGRQTVLDLIKDEITERVFPVGRLDITTSGAIILTNDGHVTHVLTHPSNGVDKQYIAVVNGQLQEKDVKKLETGVVIEGRKTAPAKLKLLKEYKDKTEVIITIHEGRNRQIRKMFDVCGHKVLELRRTEIGKIKLGNLPIGRFRHLNPNEINYLKKL